jgi:hypothetical protein
MISIRTLSLLAYFTYIFIDIIIYALGSTSWSFGIFWMVGRVIADPSLSLPSPCGVVPRVPILIRFKGNETWFSLNPNLNLPFFYFQTKSNGACIEGSYLAIQPYQSKLTFWKAKVIKNFRKFIRFFQTCFNTQ